MTRFNGVVFIVSKLVPTFTVFTVPDLPSPPLNKVLKRD